MLSYDPKLLVTAKDRKLYKFRFELDGRHVPQVLTTKKVGGGMKMEFAGMLTHSQYKRFIKFYLDILRREDPHLDANHDEYVEKMEARRAKENLKGKA